LQAAVVVIEHKGVIREIEVSRHAIVLMIRRRDT
jgi:hypothetical protein